MFADVIVYGLAIYGAVALWLQIIRWSAWWSKQRKQVLHVVILLHNSESYVERLYRSFVAMSRATGTPVIMTFIDCGSQDDTLQILRVLGKKDDHIHIVEETSVESACMRMVQQQEQHAVLIDMRLTAM